jgi:putative membrane protein
MVIEALTALAQNDHHWGPYGGGPAFWPVFPLVWFLIVAAAIVTAIVLGRRSRRIAPRREAESHLATRYASGEIDEDEYRARRAVLREKG